MHLSSNPPGHRLGKPSLAGPYGVAALPSVWRPPRAPRGRTSGAEDQTCLGAARGSRQVVGPGAGRCRRRRVSAAAHGPAGLPPAPSSSPRERYYAPLPRLLLSLDRGAGGFSPAGGTVGNKNKCVRRWGRGESLLLLSSRAALQRSQGSEVNFGGRQEPREWERARPVRGFVPGGAEEVRRRAGRPLGGPRCLRGGG